MKLLPKISLLSPVSHVDFCSQMLSRFVVAFRLWPQHLTWGSINIVLMWLIQAYWRMMPRRHHCCCCTCCCYAPAAAPRLTLFHIYHIDMLKLDPKISLYWTKLKSVRGYSYPEASKVCNSQLTLLSEVTVINISFTKSDRLIQTLTVYHWLFMRLKPLLPLSIEITFPYLDLTQPHTETLGIMDLTYW